MAKSKKPVTWKCMTGEISEITFEHENNDSIADIFSVRYIKHFPGVVDFVYCRKRRETRNATLDHVMPQLPTGVFFRGNRGEIVNLSKVTRCMCCGNYVYLIVSGGKRIKMRNQDVIRSFFELSVNFPLIAGVQKAFETWNSKFH
jgi:hypothetical protein